ncbi:amino acid transporter [Halarchaeum grantii]|uniref:Amino acid transporter n=1 Tax=Halarchaeum grantii TaxID=1193105 RepID=A0A830EYN5_9EURY|nr:amino acid permease [Halarchaeum grantii]GGL22857.1 amino acid transporter [Halarchaeum grantii]
MSGDTASDVETELSRDIGIVGAVAIGVGTMIAAGIFVLSGLAVANVGAAAIVAFLLAAIVASFTAFAYAEFASIYPESGGGYMYVANVFDTDLTYIVGWSMILGYPASAAFYLASFSDWFYRFMYPALSVPDALPFWIPGLLILALLVAVNLKGTEETGMVQILITGLKVALIGLFLYGGLQAFDAAAVTASLAENITHVRDIGLTSALVFITFFGFEAIATNAEEIKDPGRTVPRAIFFSMGFVTVVYALVVLVIVIAIHDPQFLTFLAEKAGLSSTAAAEQFIANNGEIAMGRAAQYYLGDVGFYVIIVGALLSMLSAANATILAGSRVKLAMARRDHLPSQFEDLHPSLNTPYKSVLLTGGLILFYIVAFTVVFGSPPGSEGDASAIHLAGLTFHLGLEALTHFADFMLLGGLVVVNLAVVRSRQKHPDIDRGFEVPFVPWLPAIAIVANCVLLLNVSPTSFLIGVVAEVIGVAFWFGVLSGESGEHAERETPTVVSERQPADRDYRIVVPIANPDHVEQLVGTADDIAKARDGEVIVTSAVVLPDQTPLSEGRQFVDEKRDVLDSAMAIAENADVPVSGVVRIAHDPAEAILNTVDQYDADAVLMGWSGDSNRRRDVVFGSTVDDVAERADCDVLVEETTGYRADVDEILLPAAGGVNAALSAEVASAIARTDGATVRVVHVVEADADEATRREGEERLASARETLDDDVTVETTLLEGADVADTIVDATSEADLTVLGATREGTVEQFLFGSIPESVAKRSESPVIVTKRSEGVRGRLRRLRDLLR